MPQMRRVTTKKPGVARPKSKKTRRTPPSPRATTWRPSLLKRASKRSHQPYTFPPVRGFTRRGRSRRHSFTERFAGIPRAVKVIKGMSTPSAVSLIPGCTNHLRGGVGEFFAGDIPHSASLAYLETRDPRGHVQEQAHGGTCAHVK